MPRGPWIQIFSIDAKEQQITQGIIHVHVIEELNPITIFTQMHPEHVINQIFQQQGKKFIIVQCLVLFWMKKKMLKRKIDGLCNNEKITINIFLMLHSLLGKFRIFRYLILKLKTFLALLKYWQVCDNVSCECKTWTNWWLSWKIGQVIWRCNVFLLLKEWRNYLFLRTNLMIMRMSLKRFDNQNL